VKDGWIRHDESASTDDAMAFVDEDGAKLVLSADLVEDWMRKRREIDEAAAAPLFDPSLPYEGALKLRCLDRIATIVVSTPDGRCVVAGLTDEGRRLLRGQGTAANPSTAEVDPDVRDEADYGGYEPVYDDYERPEPVEPEGMRDAPPPEEVEAAPYAFESRCPDGDGQGAPEPTAFALAVGEEEVRPASRQARKTVRRRKPVENPEDEQGDLFSFR
jgi:hypothetical protein